MSYTWKDKTFFKEENGRKWVKYLLQRVNPWRLGQWPEYLDKMTRLKANALFKARTKIMKIENNFRNMYPNNMCRICQQEDETQEYNGEMPGIPPKWYTHNN